MDHLVVWLLLLVPPGFSHEVVKRATGRGGEKRVVCYYTNWSVYRPGTAKFSPQNINPYLCTHLIYAFGGLDRENGLKPYDKYQDIEQGGYAKFTGLKTYNKNLKTMLAVGGWNEGSTRFSPLVADPERRAVFVKNTLKFLRQNHFDGLDLDWEYPAFRDGGKAKDRDNYAQLVQELREEFERESSKTGRTRLLLTMAVPAGIEYIDKGYDIPKLNKYLDFMNLLAYDYHSAFEPSVNHHAPLYSLEEESEYNFDAQLNIDATIKHYLMKGADPDKLVLGIPTYGRSYTLFNADSTDLGAPSDGPGEQGTATREKGYLAYYEICSSVKEEKWSVEQPNEKAMGPFAFKDNQWVGYDDEAIIKKKAKYVNEKNLGGIMFWSIDNDDFRGTCHSRAYPLIEAGKEALMGGSSIGTNSNKVTTSSRGGKGKAKAKPRGTTTRAPPTTTPSHTTPEPPTTPDPGSDFVCKEEGFFPHPRDCKKYFWCLDSGPSNLGIVAHQFTCPSGLYFNKAADSCDFSRNVLCNKKKVTTTTTFAPVTKTSHRTTTRFTTTTTTTTTTEAPEPEEEEEEYPEEQSEEDPETIKQLIALIKKLGGVAELEKQLEGSNSDTTSPPISKTLFERVIANKSPRFQSAFQNGPGGPQHEGLSSRSKELKRDKPQYVNIRRQKPSTTTEAPEEEYEEEEEELEEPEVKRPSLQRNRGSQTIGLEAQTDRSRPLYQPVNRFRTRTKEQQEDAPRGTRTSTLRYMDTSLLRTRTTPAQELPTSSPPSRYVTLRRERPQVKREDAKTDNEVLDELVTEEIEPQTTTSTKAPRLKVSDVISTTPVYQTSTSIVTRVVEGGTERQKVPLHKLKQFLSKNNILETTTESQKPKTSTEPERKIPGFIRRRPEIVITTTTRAPPLYLSRRRGTTQPTSTEQFTDKPTTSRGFAPSRNRFRTTTESDSTTRVNRFRQTTEAEVSARPNRFSYRSTSTTEGPFLPTRKYFSSNRFSSRRRTTTDKEDSTQASSTSNSLPESTSRKYNVIYRRTTTTTTQATSSSAEEPSSPAPTEMTLNETTTNTGGLDLSSVIDIRFGDIDAKTTEDDSVNSVVDSNVDTSNLFINTDSSLNSNNVDSREVDVTTESGLEELLTTYPEMMLTTVSDLPSSTERSTVDEAINKRKRTRVVVRPKSKSLISESVTPNSLLRNEKGVGSTLSYDFSKTSVNTKQDGPVKGGFKNPAIRKRVRVPVTTESSPVNVSPGRRRVVQEVRRRTSSTESPRTNSLPSLRSQSRGSVKFGRTTEIPQTLKPTSGTFKPRTTSKTLKEPASPDQDKKKKRVLIRGKSRNSELLALQENNRFTFVQEANGSPISVSYKNVNKSNFNVSVGLKFNDSPSVYDYGLNENYDYLDYSYRDSTKNRSFENDPSFSGLSNSDDLNEVGKNARSAASVVASKPLSRETGTGKRETAGTYRRPTTRGSLKAVDSLLNEDLHYDSSEERVDTYIGENEVPPRARRPVVRRPVQRKTTTTTVPPETSTRERTTAQLLRQRLSRFKATRTSPSPPTTIQIVEVTGRTRKYEVQDSLLDASQETAVPHETEERLPDLANQAVAAIQALATSPPTPPPTTTPLTTKYIEVVRPSGGRKVSGTTLAPRPFSRGTPRPFAKVEVRSRGPARAIQTVARAQTVAPRPTRPPTIVDYDYGDDYYAEPIDLPLSGKVRIHTDGYIECLDVGNFPHPFSCRKFISCAKMENGHLLGWEYTCPKGLSFDPIGGICNWNAGLGCKE